MSWGSASGNRTLRGVDRVVPELRTFSAFPSIREMGADYIHGRALTPQRACAFPVDPDAVVARADGVAQVNSVEVARDRDSWRIRLDNKRPGARKLL